MAELKLNAYLNDSAAADVVASVTAVVMFWSMPGTNVVLLVSASSCERDEFGSPAANAAAATFFGVMLANLLLRTVI